MACPIPDSGLQQQQGLFRSQRRNGVPFSPLPIPDFEAKRHRVCCCIISISSMFYLSLRLSVQAIPIDFSLDRNPGSGEYNKFFSVGTYLCAGCGTSLYRSATKFNSPCGWPSFYEGLPGAINRSVSFFSLTLASFTIALFDDLNSQSLGALSTSCLMLELQK